MNLFSDLFFAFWFFIPAGLANMMPVYAAHVPFLKPFSYPLDFYKKYNNARIFGDHKTIRGLVFGIIGAIIIVYVQKYLYTSFPTMRSLIPLDYDSLNPWMLGFLMGTGALLGDMIKSFFKRQLNIPPGKSWFPFDQIDFILGAAIATAFYIQLPIYLYIYILILYFFLHLLVAYTGYILKLKDSPI